MANNQMAGHVVWTDLTVPNADEIRDFYAEVVGFRPESIDMGGYSDYMMMAQGEAPQPGGAVGICHAKGNNAHLPAQWLIYFAVDDLDRALSAVDRLGGRRLGDIQAYGDDRFAAIEDPAGAVCALFEKVSGG